MSCATARWWRSCQPRDATVEGLHQHMVGRQLHHEYYREARQSRAGRKGRARSERARQAMAPSAMSSFALHEGEVLGIAGVIGSGREDLARCLAGHDAATMRHAASCHGKPVALGCARQARPHGHRPCPERAQDRRPRRRRFGRREHDARGPARFVCRRRDPLRRRGARGQRAGSTGSRSRRRRRHHGRQPLAAATSRRSCSPNGASPASGC